MTRLVQIDGLPVFDATEPLTIKVTKTDIERARRNRQEPDQCAVSRACRRGLHVIEARVHLSRTYLRLNKHNWLRFLTPAGMRDEIIAFDRGGRFEPGEFVFGVPAKNEKLGTKRRGGRSTGKGKKRATPRWVTDVRSGPA